MDYDFLFNSDTDLIQFNNKESVHGFNHIAITLYNSINHVNCKFCHAL